jgi:hypothetical protein
MYFITTDENINASRLSSEDHLKNTISMTIFLWDRAVPADELFISDY